jgi:uncharacterized protein YjbJ (UPF0337 family)
MVAAASCADEADADAEERPGMLADPDRPGKERLQWFKPTRGLPGQPERAMVGEGSSRNMAPKMPAQGPARWSGHAEPSRRVAVGRPHFQMKRENSNMDWNRVEGNWKQVKGKVREKWGQLTNDDLDTIAGKRDQLEGKIQERYGIAKDQVRKDIDDWYTAQKW